MRVTGGELINRRLKKKYTLILENATLTDMLESAFQVSNLCINCYLWYLRLNCNPTGAVIQCYGHKTMTFSLPQQQSSQPYQSATSLDTGKMHGGFQIPIRPGGGQARGSGLGARPPAPAELAGAQAAAARPPGHLPEEQEIRKTANANFAAAPMFPRRRGSRSKFSLDIQFPGSSSETNLLV